MLTSLAAPAFVGLIAVTFGWVPSQESAPEPAKAASSDGYEYLVQLSPLDLEALNDGRASWVTSELPADVGPIDRVRVYVGAGEPPRRLTKADAESPRRIAAAKRGQPYTVAKPVAPEWGDAALIPADRKASVDPQRRTAYQNPNAWTDLENGFQQAADQTGEAFRELGRGIDSTARGAGEALNAANPFGYRPTQPTYTPNGTTTTAATYPPVTTVPPPEPIARVAQTQPLSPPIRSPPVATQPGSQPTPTSTPTWAQRGPALSEANDTPIATPFASGGFAEPPNRPLTRVEGRTQERNTRREDDRLSGLDRRSGLGGTGTNAATRAGRGGFAALPNSDTNRDRRQIDSFAQRDDPANDTRQTSTRTAWGDTNEEPKQPVEPQQASVVPTPSPTGDVAQLVLIVASLGAAFFMWMTHMELRAKYRALLRSSPGGGGYQGRQAA